MTTTVPTPAKIVPSEVGWQFVPQYYTFVNKQPSRLHCFYTKNSTFIHGTEGEDGKPCYGQHEIHQKILSIGFQDCKVFIHSVDAQSSANGGIIIQVIGEMSNNGEPWRKFAQTFFLAEQPNGYFVLNDIFRFLKEESPDDEEEEDVGDATVPSTAEDDPNALQPDEIVAEPAPGVPTSYHPNPAQQSRADPPPAIEHLLAPVESAPVDDAPVTNGVNGTDHHDAASDVAEETPAVPEPVEPEAEPEAEVSPPTPASPSRVATPVQTPTPAPEPLTAPPTPAPVEKKQPEAAPVAAPTPAPPTPAAAPAAPPKPAAPKTWANLAASKSSGWGANLVADSKGVSAAAAPSPPAPTPKANGPRPSTGPSPSAPLSTETSSNAHPAFTAASSVTTPQCFVKSVTDNVHQQLLRDVLAARFGPIKELDVVRGKAIAFLEFTTVEAARRAIIASLPVQQGGEGGIWLAEGETTGPYSRDVPRITVETRKERGDRPPPRPRGGAPGGESRGGFRGAPGRGRGGQRGVAPPSAK